MNESLSMKTSKFPPLETQATPQGRDRITISTFDSNPENMVLREGILDSQNIEAFIAASVELKYAMYKEKQRTNDILLNLLLQKKAQVRMENNKASPNSPIQSCSERPLLKAEESTNNGIASIALPILPTTKINSKQMNFAKLNECPNGIPGLLNISSQTGLPSPCSQKSMATQDLPPILTMKLLPPFTDCKPGNIFFPQKLHQLLLDLEKEAGGMKIASFLPHGRSFAIHNPRAFVKSVMPKYFRMSCFASFQRQLNLYDFRRVTHGPDQGAYYHAFFIRGLPFLCEQMKRKQKQQKAHNNAAA